MDLKICPLKVKSGSFINYCYLIINQKLNTAIIIDPAWELDVIEEALRKHNAKLSAILLTHHHFDHVNLAGTLAKCHQISVFMSKAEINYYDFHCENLQEILHFEPFTLSDILIKPIFTPGHTYGGTSYLIEKNLFCGDTLFIEGCGICCGTGANPITLFNTIQMLKTKISYDIKIFPGHSYGQPPGKPFKYLLENNIYLQLNEEEAFVNYRMRKNQSNLFSFK